MSKVVLIAGASKGIGLKIAHQFQQQGYLVFGTSRQPQDTIHNIRLLPLDVTDAGSVDACVQQVIDFAGRIDILVNNVGYDLYGAAEDTHFDELIAQMDTNFYGAVRLIRAVLPMMRQQGSGKIINISSIGGLSPLPFNSAYSASKMALEGYSEALRYELLPFNIFVSLVEPGQARTETLATSIRSTATSSLYSSFQIAQRAQAAGATASLQPTHIAQTILRIAQTPYPRLRYLVGSQAYSVMLMRRWLPARLFEAVMLRLFVMPFLMPNRMEKEHANA